MVGEGGDPLLALRVTEKGCHFEAAAEESPPLLLQRFLALLEMTSTAETSHCIRGDRRIGNFVFPSR